MADVTIEPDEGYLTVEVKQPGGLPPVEVHIDVFEANNAYSAIHAEHFDPVARGAAWVQWLVDKGLPPLSHGAAFGLAGQLTAAAEQYAKKKPGIVLESADSPASTASPSSA